MENAGGGLTVALRVPSKRQNGSKDCLIQNPLPIKIETMKEYDKMICKEEQSGSFFAGFLQRIVEAFTPISSEPGTVFLRDLRRISPVRVCQMLRTLTDRPIFFDLRNRHELDCFPFAICDSLPMVGLALDARLRSVPPPNGVILYGTNDESVGRMTTSSPPEGSEICC